ncbi:VWA domain-containing protein [Trueperella sp. LYQ143]|uniref:VWA domain-containing protein n=1 Tax=unclassified Trueperella TaxID=2630174 RepID=UPI0039838721
MVNPIVAIVLGCLLAAAALLGWVRRTPTATSREGAWVAHTATAQRHPRFRARLLIWRIALLAMVGCAVVMGASAAILAGRPVRFDTASSPLATRDIVLCLDVSESMADVDSQLLDRFAQIAEKFQGERVALSIFNSDSLLVFPLTDDYEVIQERLTYLSQVLHSPHDLQADELHLLEGTWVGSNMFGSSLIGDGLASCVFSFDALEEARSRSIILATDNELSGAPIYPFNQAVDLAKQHHINLYGIAAGSKDSPDVQAMERGLTAAGMHFYPAATSSAAANIVDEIQRQEAVDLDAMSQTVEIDQVGPLPAIVLAALAVFLVMAGRFRI